jgi:hypothetical protein
MQRYLTSVYQRRILFFVTIEHLKIFCKELAHGTHVHSGYQGSTYTHLELARANFKQWVGPSYN